MLMTTDVSAQQKLIKEVDWTLAAKLQNPDGSTSLGYAGAINAINNNVMIVAGGANFPDKMPWEGGSKYYSDKIQVLQKKAEQYLWNTAVTATLPEAIAYCGNTATDFGVVYAGGENEKGLSKHAFLLNWDAGHQKINIKALPDLPFAVTNIGLSQIRNVVYAIGGDLQKQSSNAAFSLDLNQENPQWQTLPTLPVALANAVVVAQAGEIYVIGGRTKTASGISDLHHTVYAYQPEKHTIRRRCTRPTSGLSSTRTSRRCCSSRPSRVTAWARAAKARTPRTRPRSSPTTTSAASATASTFRSPTTRSVSCRSSGRPTHTPEMRYLRRAPQGARRLPAAAPQAG